MVESTLNSLQEHKLRVKFPTPIVKNKTVCKVYQRIYIPNKFMWKFLPSQ